MGAPHLGLEALLAEWRERGSKLREWSGDERLAVPYDRCADELEKRLAELSAEELTYAEAARLVGRSSETIAKAVRVGRIENVGRKHRPRVRRGAVQSTYPRRAVEPVAPRSYDPGADARFLLGCRRGGSE